MLDERLPEVRANLADECLYFDALPFSFLVEAGRKAYQAPVPLEEKLDKLVEDFKIAPYSRPIPFYTGNDSRK